MESLVIVLLGGAVVVLALLFVARRAPANPREAAALRDEIRHLHEQLTSENHLLHQRLEGIDTRMSQTQHANTDLAQGIFETLGDVQRATSEVATRAREFNALQDLLRAPKPRGGIGEAMLKELLRQVLPPGAFETQYRFKSGTIVDAVVRADGRLVCIDSKFPLANYQRMCDAADDVERTQAERAFAQDVEGHIRDISARYIVPDEKTLDFAVMYVPAEGVYGEVLRIAHRKRPLFELAIEHRVVPMSPLTMYGYLQTILYGLKSLQISKNAEAILDFCARLHEDVRRFADSYRKLGVHLGNARSQYESGSGELDRFQDRLARASDVREDEGPRPPLEVVAD